MKMQTMWRGVAMADEAIAALRKQILAFKGVNNQPPTPLVEALHLDTHSYRE